MADLRFGIAAMPPGKRRATAASRGFMVATRDTSPFAAAGLRTINPWAPPAMTAARRLPAQPRLWFKISRGRR